MNKKLFFRAAALAIAATLAGCSGGIMPDGTTESQEGTQGMTEFAVARDNAKTSGAPWTRTSGEYTGSSVKFYWTSGDKLWINDGSVLKASKRSNIPAANGKELTAKFWFDGNYTAPNYPVRYTGSTNTQGGKVTIKAAQAQQTPNDGSHIGDDGDCGTATATKGSDGKYRFMLDHKASYLTFMPYYSKGFAPSVKVTQIKVTADKPLAGTFDFNDAGIQTYTVTAASNSITLTLNGGGTNGFEIPTAIDYSKNAAIMVINPDSYTNFTVEYTLHDQATNVTGTVTKNYGSIACYAGKNKKIAADLAVPHYDNKYYMWDAAQHYWQGFEQYQPKLNGQTNSTYYPKVSTDARWFTARTYPDYAHNINMITCPNVNAIAWYVLHGDPHWDETRLWSTMDHLYNKGIWMKKSSEIPGFDWELAPDGTDWRTKILPSALGNLSNDILDSTEDYFYLPCLGRYMKGELVVGDYGLYWSNTAGWAHSNADGGYYFPSLYFYKNFIILHYDNGTRAQKIWNLDIVPTD